MVSTLAPVPLTKVYAGLSVSRAQVAAILPEARFAGPVARGDVAADVVARIPVIVIVDGRFFQSLAVAPGELMDALRRGVRLYGCSSMGALRAAELASHGMHGHGKIFEYIRDQRVFRDDLLGQIFQEEPLRALTVPYVDLHFSLRELERKKSATRRESETILRATAELPFADRSLLGIQARLTARHGKAAAPLVELLRRGLRGARQKQIDALATLRKVRSDLASIHDANTRLNARAAAPKRARTRKKEAS